MEDYILYTHPDGVFSTGYPSEWNVLNESYEGVASVLFQSPDLRLSARILVQQAHEDHSDEINRDILIGFLQNVASFKADFVGEEISIDADLGITSLAYTCKNDDIPYIGSSGLWSEPPFSVLYTVEIPEDSEEGEEDLLFSIVDGVETDPDAHLS